ncbi:MAG: ATP-binding protein [Deltaproteobacteria bacterium]|nr:ATP-binding protein [Deltaproteobacteria bacterium]
MKFIERYLPIWSLEKEILAPKMIFIAGPRQSGKTTLIKHFLDKKGCSSLFFNWDTPKVKAAYRQDPVFFESDARMLCRGGKKVWVALDEIHKRTMWKDILKGYYDQFYEIFRFVISGSARLDMFRKTGDALIGRYFLFHLYPFSLSETGSKKFENLHLWYEIITDENRSNLFDRIADEKPLPHDLWDQMYEFGPFPEPLLKGDKAFSNLWHQDYLSLYLREEIRDLTRISDIDGVETLVSLLPPRVGSMLSINSLKEDLHVSHGTVSTWLDSLTKLYLIFSLRPWQSKIHKAIKKEKKYYFYDWSYVPEENEGARFENMVAAGLNRICNQLGENGLGLYELFFVRDLLKREVDFLIAKGRTPVLLLEAKNNNLKISGFALNLAKKLGDIPIIQLVHKNGILKKSDKNAYIISAGHFFSCFP